MIVKLLTEQTLGFLGLTRGCTGTSASTLVKMPHCWKSHIMAQILLIVHSYLVTDMNVILLASLT